MLCVPFDLRAEDRLVADVHRQEQVGVRQDGGDSVEPPKGAIRVGEKPPGLGVHRRGWVRRERCRNERP